MIDEPVRLKAPPPKQIPRTPPALVVKFFLKHGTVVDWPIPADRPFAFAGLVTGIRSTGCFLADDLYIPESEIACIGFGTGTARVQHPLHVTRQ